MQARSPNLLIRVYLYCVLSKLKVTETIAKTSKCKLSYFLSQLIFVIVLLYQFFILFFFFAKSSFFEKGCICLTILNRRKSWFTCFKKKTLSANGSCDYWSVMKPCFDDSTLCSCGMWYWIEYGPIFLYFLSIFDKTSDKNTLFFQLFFPSLQLFIIPTSVNMQLYIIELLTNEWPYDIDE